MTVPLAHDFGAAGALTTFALDQNADAFENVFQTPDAITITKLGINFASFTAGFVGLSPNYKISLQGVDSSGNPDGTIKGGGSPASKEFNATGWSNNTFHWITLDNAYTCSRGEYLALVVKYSSENGGASPDGSFDFITLNVTATYLVNFRFPYGISNNSGSRTRLTTFPSIYGYGSSSKKYGNPYQTALSQSITGSAEFGAVFTLPAAWGNTFKVAGLKFFSTAAAAGGLTVTLYDGGAAGDTTVLQNASYDTDLSQATTAGIRTIYFDESTLSTLKYGSTYRVAIGASSGTHTLSGIVLGAADDADAFPLGQSAYGTTRSGGNWTDATTNRPFIELILDDLTGTGSAFVF